MSVTSSRTIQIQFSGDNNLALIQSALDNISSPGETLITTLLVGNNTLTPPVITGIVVRGLTIIPPAGNTTVITVKGANGDSGIPIHVTDPFSIGLDAGFSSLVLSVGTQVNGVRVIWS